MYLNCLNLNPLAESTADYIQDVLEQKSFKVTQGYHHSLYIEAMSPKAIQSAIPPSHCFIVRKITLVPMKEVMELYSPHEVFTSTFWVWVKHGIYKNNISYMLSLVLPQLQVIIFYLIHFIMYVYACCNGNVGFSGSYHSKKELYGLDQSTLSYFT